MDIALYFIVLIAFAIIFTLEVIQPASEADCDKRWQILASALGASTMAATIVAGQVFQDFFESAALLGLSQNNSAPLVGLYAFLVASFVIYFWHRATHKSDLLWRMFHQLHHSPSRIEAHTAFFVHPFDGMAATLLNGICAYMIIGADAEGAAWGLLFAALNNLYNHMDLRTPRWVGFILQRPEMHRVHHKRGHHADNYGLPLWDILFGTFENPKERVELCGFEPEKEIRIAEMIRMQNVNE